MLNKKILTALLAGVMAAGSGAAFANDPISNRAGLELKDGQTITLTGTVEDTGGKVIALNTGREKVKVDFEDWSNFDSDEFFQDGSTITVSGVVEDKMIGGPEINAVSVFAADTGMRYSLSQEEITAIQEGAIEPAAGPAYFERTTTTYKTTHAPRDTVVGTVTGIHGRNVQVQTDAGVVTIDTLQLGYDPTSLTVSPTIQEGDKISISASNTGSERDFIAREVISVQKPWQSKPVHGQAPSQKPNTQQAEDNMNSSS